MSTSGFGAITNLPTVTVTAVMGSNATSSAVFDWIMGFINNLMGGELSDHADPFEDAPGSALTSQEQALLKAFLQILELAANGTNYSGTAFQGLSLAQISPEVAARTIDWGLRDIETYRLTDGLHVVNPQGSAIAWQNIEVEWSLYDEGGTAQDVFENFLRAHGGESD